jgi:hypothetical protein
LSLSQIQILLYVSRSVPNLSVVVLEVAVQGLKQGSIVGDECFLLVQPHQVARVVGVLKVDFLQNGTKCMLDPFEEDPVNWDFTPKPIRQLLIRVIDLGSEQYDGGFLTCSVERVCYLFFHSFEIEEVLERK